MKKVINTVGYGTTEGLADQITLPNGHLIHTEIDSLLSDAAAKKGCAVKTVEFFGACISANLDYRAHRKFPIQVDEVSVADFIDRIATSKERKEFMRQVM